MHERMHDLMYSQQINDYQTGFNSSICDVVIIYLVIKKRKSSVCIAVVTGYG